MKKLTKEQKREIAAVAAKKDEDIDLFRDAGGHRLERCRGGQVLSTSEEASHDASGRRRGRMAEELRARLPDQGEPASATRDVQYPDVEGGRKTAPGIVVYMSCRAQRRRPLKIRPRNQSRRTPHGYLISDGISRYTTTKMAKPPVAL